MCQPWLASDPKSFLVFSNVIHETFYLVSSIGFQSRTAIGDVEAVKVVEQPKIDWANPPAELIEETDHVSQASQLQFAILIYR